ncbi:hypothetical protein H0A36_27135 [Endozoicomonas sp. SM1973]|uniref:Uncharacterized protein n=1 Tax=Spartinivicinus marinus TaxID=2994442 RepID=A0A853II34_9GAMM|nr:hypothetical protein [Spartinivicinus marinus]MCX4024732.1 hypothetical protein [Spartinivicinus marinus]NYZ69694.1 hypothetical protein [Spartinivicinus marinus]
MPLLQSDKENISKIIAIVFDLHVPPHNVNDNVVRATEEGIRKLESCAGKSHALGTLLQCIPKSPNVYGWLASCGTAVKFRHAAEADPAGIKSSVMCMNGSSQIKTAIQAAAIGF